MVGWATNSYTVTMQYLFNCATQYCKTLLKPNVKRVLENLRYKKLLTQIHSLIEKSAWVLAWIIAHWLFGKRLGKMTKIFSCYPFYTTNYSVFSIMIPLCLIFWVTEIFIIFILEQRQLIWGAKRFSSIAVRSSVKFSSVHTGHSDICLWIDYQDFPRAAVDFK